jgi:hypothetical protein
MNQIYLFRGCGFEREVPRQHHIRHDHVPDPTSQAFWNHQARAPGQLCHDDVAVPDQLGVEYGIGGFLGILVYRIKNIVILH